MKPENRKDKQMEFHKLMAVPTLKNGSKLWTIINKRRRRITYIIISRDEMYEKCKKMH
jgi:hypothetical protein